MGVEKIDGLGKPITYKTLQDWVDEHEKDYIRTNEDAYNALGTLCDEGLIGPGKKSNTIQIPYLKHLVTELGDKMQPAQVDKIFKAPSDGGAGYAVPGDTCSLEELITFL